MKKTRKGEMKAERGEREVRQPSRTNSGSLKILQKGVPLLELKIICDKLQRKSRGGTRFDGTQIIR